MGILPGELIRARIREKDYKKKLLITPLLSGDQIGPASVDIRLGSSIIVPRKTYMDSQDVTDPDHVSQVERRLYERITLRYHSKFVLHPNEIILGATFEYISLPDDIFATLASRSSWGRLGLVVATASIVQPGFKGALTLELSNLSDSPISLYPGLLIGQLVFYEVTGRPGPAPVYTGRYDCPTDAGLPQFFGRKSDEEMLFWSQGSQSGK